MYSVQVSSDPIQTQKIVMPDGTEIDMTIKFVPLQYGWFISSFTYVDFNINGLRIVNSPNMLHQFRNIIPYGLACFSAEDREPSLQTDFSSGSSNLYVLTSDEVAYYTSYLNG